MGMSVQRCRRAKHKTYGPIDDHWVMRQCTDGRPTMRGQNRAKKTPNLIEVSFLLVVVLFSLI